MRATGARPRAHRSRRCGPGRAVIAAAYCALLLLLPPPPPAAAAADAAKDHALDLEMEPLNVPLITHDRVLGQVFVVVTLAVADAEARRVVAARMPRLRDALFRSLYRDAAAGRMESGKFDLDRTKRRFQSAADRIVGDHVVEVLISRAQLFRNR